MTPLGDQPPSPQSQDESIPFPIAGATLLWVSAQIAALALAAARVPLWPRFMQPAEDDALAVMFATQIALVAMLASILFDRSASRAIVMILTTIPFTALAGFLAATEPVRLCAAALYTMLWMCSVAMWIGVARTALARSTVTVAANLLAIGGVMLLYLRNEFSIEAHAQFAPADALFSPILGASSLAGLMPGEKLSVFSVFALFTASGIAILLARRKRATGYPQALSTIVQS